MIDMCVCDAENKLYENKIIGTNDKVIFITENCAVMQCFDNGFYTYYAVNLNTLKKKYLSKRKNPILKENYEQLAQRVNNLDINKNDMTLITTRYDRANNLLRHIFSYILPTEGFSFRKNQLDLAVEMLNGLQTKNVALMEAEVGTGKTHAYIIAVIIYNLFNDITKTTLISTSTIALQKAITEEYIPQISDILMKYRIIRKPLDFAVRKGKSHYICDLKLKTYLSLIKKNNSPKDEKLIETLETLSDVDEQKIDLDIYPLTRYVKDRICVTNKCSELCTKYDSCRFIRFTRECMYSGYYFQIANHNYVFADIMSYKPLLPQYKVIVFDEAHKLYDVAKQMYGCYLTEGEFTELIKYITESKADSLKELSDSIENDYPKLFNRISGADKDTANPNERRETNIDVFAISYMKSIADTLERITDSVFFCPEIKLFVRKRRIRNMCESIKNKLQVFLKPDNRDNYISLIDGFDAIVADYPELWDKLDKNNLYIILAAYCHFCNEDKTHNNKVFGKFLCDWFTKIKDTTDYDPKPNENKAGTKHKTKVLGKLAIIDSECKKYMKECAAINDSESENIELIADFENPLEKAINFENDNQRKDFNNKALMVVSDYPYCDFEEETVEKFRAYYEDRSQEAKADLLYDVEMYTDCLNDYLAEIPSDSEFISSDNLLCLLHVVKKAQQDDISDTTLMDWIKYFVTDE